MAPERMGETHTHLRGSDRREGDHVLARSHSPVRTPTRLYAFLDESKITDEARSFFATTLDFRALVIRCWGMRRPPWCLMGIVFPTGGSVGHVRFESITEAKAAAERYFGPAMGSWQQTPAGEDPGNVVARQFPGFIDWRVTAPVELEPLFRAKLRFAEFVDEDDHDHCTFCWDDFQVQREVRAATGVFSTASSLRTTSGCANPATTTYETSFSSHPRFPRTADLVPRCVRAHDVGGGLP